jgi:superfamily II DNA/RNA helicase
VQFDPPDDPRDYIHRVGRTARAGKVGKSLLFLLESELGFLRYLKQAKVPLNEFSFPTDRIANVQSQVRYSSMSHTTFLMISKARKAATEELFPPPIRARWLPVISSGIRVLFVEKDI